MMSSKGFVDPDETGLALFWVPAAWNVLCIASSYKLFNNCLSKPDTCVYTRKLTMSFHAQVRLRKCWRSVGSLSHERLDCSAHLLIALSAWNTAIVSSWKSHLEDDRRNVVSPSASTIMQSEIRKSVIKKAWTNTYDKGRMEYPVTGSRCTGSTGS